MARVALDRGVIEVVSEVVERLRRVVQAYFGPECVGHDLSHLDRVHGLALQLRASEGGNELVIAAASYVHDFHRVIERLGTARDSDDERRAVETKIIDALSAAEFPSELVDAVTGCVAFTDRYSFAGHRLDAPSLEARIVRDADNLDALGAIGIARAFMFGGTLGEPIWNDDVAPAAKYSAGITSSIVHHFHEKLLRLRDDMLTEAGARLAEERHELMLSFLERLREEWEFAGLSQSRAPALR